MKNKSQPPKIPDQKDCTACQIIMPGHYRCSRCLALMHLETVYERNEARVEIERLREALKNFTDPEYYVKEKPVNEKPGILFDIVELAGMARQALSPRTSKLKIATQKARNKNERQ